MGNVHALAHRVTALSMACLSSAALTLLTLAGTHCSFVEVKAKPNRYLMTPNKTELTGLEQAYIGVTCDTEGFYEPTDRMWNISRKFFWTSLALAAATTALSWGVGTCVPPGKRNWRILSILAAMTAVLEVPVFMIVEAGPCNVDVLRQTCSLDIGSYFLIASVVMFVVVTLSTQFLDPPKWADELDAWVASKREIAIKDVDMRTHESTHRDVSRDSTAGGIYVTSTNEDGLAIWPLDHPNAHYDSDDDAISSVSSKSERAKDVETGNTKRTAAKQQAPKAIPRQSPTSVIDTNDNLIRKGAAMVMASLRSTEAMKAPVPLENPCGGLEDIVPKAEVDRMRCNALMDSDYSELTEREPGLHLTIVCPDGTTREMSGPNCFVNDEKTMLEVITAGVKTEDHNNDPELKLVHSQSGSENEEGDKDSKIPSARKQPKDAQSEYSSSVSSAPVLPKVLKPSRRATTFQQTLIPRVRSPQEKTLRRVTSADPKISNYEKEAVSGVNSVQGSDVSNAKDTISILDDLVQMEPRVKRQSSLKLLQTLPIGD